MIERIYSKNNPEKLLHLVCRSSQIKDPRIDVVDDDNFLQLAILNYEKGKTFKPHKHIYKSVGTQAIAQESWVVLRGKVKAIFYDEDDEILQEEILNEGDLSITLFGGHNYEILEEKTLVLEYKTGPYYGQSLDKVFIDD
jgi:cupin fold WbuC family metalloprotein